MLAARPMKPSSMCSSSRLPPNSRMPRRYLSHAAWFRGSSAKVVSKRLAANTWALVYAGPVSAKNLNWAPGWDIFLEELTRDRSSIQHRSQP